MPKRINATRTLTILAGISRVAILRSDEVPGQSELTNLSNFTDAVDAYIHGYPLLMMGITERVGTTVPGTKPNAGRAPLNQFTKSTALPNGSYKDVVLPSTTSLHASAFLNLAAEPVMMHRRVTVTRSLSADRSAVERRTGLQLDPHSARRRSDLERSRFYRLSPHVLARSGRAARQVDSARIQTLN